MTSTQFKNIAMAVIAVACMGILAVLVTDRFHTTPLVAPAAAAVVAPVAAQPAEVQQPATEMVSTSTVPVDWKTYHIDKTNVSFCYPANLKIMDGWDQTDTGRAFTAGGVTVSTDSQVINPNDQYQMTDLTDVAEATMATSQKDGETITSRASGIDSVEYNTLSNKHLGWTKITKQNNMIVTQLVIYPRGRDADFQQAVKTLEACTVL